MSQQCKGVVGLLHDLNPQLIGRSHSPNLIGQGQAEIFQNAGPFAINKKQLNPTVDQ